MIYEVTKTNFMTKKTIDYGQYGSIADVKAILRGYRKDDVVGNGTIAFYARKNSNWMFTVKTVER